MKSPKPPPQSDRPDDLPEVLVSHFTDPTTVGDSIELVNLDVVNLDPEQFEIKRVSVPLVDCRLIYTYTSAAVRTRVLVHNGFETCYVLGPQAHGSIDGAKLYPHAMMATAPGADVEVIVERGYESVGWLMPPGVMDKHLTMRGMRKNFVMPAGHEVWHPSTEVAQELFELGFQIARAAESSPDVFNNSHFARFGAQVEFMDALLATIETCSPDESADSDKRGKSYSQIVRTCEDYTLGLEGRRPYMSELCEAAQVSERTLQKAFKEIMGMSPVTYLHRLRLHRARDELRKAESGSTTVTDVALNWGFWHFGEFSRAYKNCFGEVPSKTLKRNSNDKS